MSLFTLRGASAGHTARASALEAYAGTAVFISHDRYFLDRMADRIVEVANGGVRSFPGGYSDWLGRAPR